MRVLQASGVEIITDEGVLLDGISGTFNLPMGFNHSEIEEAVREQQLRYSFLPSDLRSDAVDGVRQKLIDVVGKPVGLDCVRMRDLVGSTAVEFALKTAEVISGGVGGHVSFEGCHHGQTFKTISLTESEHRRRGLSFPMGNVLPFCADFELVEKVVTAGYTASVVVECIQGNGGNRGWGLGGDGYLRKLQQICNDRGVLFIVDEVQTAIGRVGSMSSCEKYGLRPDMLVVGKGLGNGYPIAAVLLKSELNVLLHLQHSFTCGEHPLSIAAANKVLDLVPATLAEQQTKDVQDAIEGFLVSMCNDLGAVVEIRGEGHMWGVQLPSAEFAKGVVKVAKEECGLRLRSSRDGFGDVVKFRPALITTVAQVEEMLDRLERAIVLVERRQPC